MLESPHGYGGFARYTYRGDREVTMGYEYENRHGSISGYGDREDRLKAALVATTLAALPNYFQAEYEGFGNATGVEIKSVVAPLFLHKQFWNRYVSKIPFDLSPNSSRNDSGIHVSISRTPFTIAQQTKVFAFLHDPANRPHFFKMSKRTQHSFDVNCPSNPNGNRHDTWDETLRRYVPNMSGPADWRDHYNMINTENPNRFEFRLFAAHPTLMLPALEMCDALFKMAPDYDVITMQNFRTYIGCFKKYEHIKEHCIATLDHSPS